MDGVLQRHHWAEAVGGRSSDRTMIDSYRGFGDRHTGGLGIGVRDRALGIGVIGTERT